MSVTMQQWGKAPQLNCSSTVTVNQMHKCSSEGNHGLQELCTSPKGIPTGWSTSYPVVYINVADCRGQTLCTEAGGRCCAPSAWDILFQYLPSYIFRGQSIVFGDANTPFFRTHKPLEFKVPETTFAAPLKVSDIINCTIQSLTHHLWCRIQRQILGI